MAIHRVRIGVLLAVIMGLGAAQAIAAPLLETVFGYQGQLKQAGVPVDGPTDLRFSLWTAAAGPGQVGGAISRLGVDVVDGLFAVQLDFGVAAFQGEARWLQIEARHPAGVGGYTMLSPRQALTSAPYALHTRGVYVSADGKVGVGDATPVASLTVGEGDKFQVLGGSGDLVFADDQASITFPAADGTNAPMIELFASGTNNGTRMVLAHSPAFPSYGLQYVDTLDQFRFLGDAIPRMVIDLRLGHVGIGTTDATHRLTVQSETRDSLRLIGPGDFGSVARLSFGDGEFVYIEEDLDDTVRVQANRIALTGGNVGVGTLDPQAKLDVQATGGTGVWARTNGSGLGGPAIRADNAASDGIGIWSVTNSSDSNLVLTNGGSGDLIRGFTGPGGGNFVFRVENNGKTTVSVLTITGGADLAEPFQVGGQSADGAAIKPGTVMVIDSDRPGHLVPSTCRFDRRVAGVVSGANGLAPGMVMGARGDTHADGDCPVALTGRVWCQCDTAAGPIQPGDLLTTSDRPGHAMKVTDFQVAQGAILGKAMTPLTDGTGLVLVLVSLQ